MIQWGTVPAWVAAAGTVGTLIVAIVAARFAYSQIIESRTLRIEQAAPYVVVDFEPMREVGGSYMELVVRNTGLTTARDVSIDFKPELATTFDDDPNIASFTEKPLRDHAIFKSGIPSMPPGREYRVLFDSMADRFEAGGLPHKYDVNVYYTDSFGERRDLPQVVDLGMYYGRIRIDRHGLHHMAKTLRAWAKADGVKNF